MHACGNSPAARGTAAGCWCPRRPDPSLSSPAGHTHRTTEQGLGFLTLSPSSPHTPPQYFHLPCFQSVRVIRGVNYQAQAVPEQV